MSWIQTHTGKKFFPFEPESQDIDIKDIAHSLSLICRYNGHCKTFYSVAEHCIRVSEIVSEKNKLWGLLHDAAETYLGDICHPIKKYFCINYNCFGDGTIPFDCYEDAILYKVADKFNLTWETPYGFPQEVHNADKILASTEKRDLLVYDLQWCDLPEPLSDKIKPQYDSRIVEKAFLDTYHYLVNNLYHTGQKRFENISNR